MVSSRLSALQHDFVEAFFSEPSAFFLTGGGALAGYHLGHRFALDDIERMRTQLIERLLVLAVPSA